MLQVRCLSRQQLYTYTAADSDYFVQLEIIGQAIKVYIDGVLRISATDAAISAAGKAGLSVYSEATVPTDANGWQFSDFSAKDGPAVYAVGPASFSSADASTINMTATAASGGAGGYTYQWYRSTLVDLRRAGNILSGATALTLADSVSLVANTPYYYKLIATDSALATATSNQP